MQTKEHIELDGDYHQSTAQYLNLDKWLEEREFFSFHFWDLKDGKMFTFSF